MIVIYSKNCGDLLGIVLSLCVMWTQNVIYDFWDIWSHFLREYRFLKVEMYDLFKFLVLET